MFRLLNCYSFIVIILSIRVCLPRNLNNDDEQLEPAYVSRVVNGWPAKLGDVPYQLALKTLIPKYYPHTYFTFCGASLIGPNKVVSAAHCFEKEKGLCESPCFGGGKVNKRTVEQAFAVAENLANFDTYGKDGEGKGQWRRLASMYFPKNYNFPKNDICVGFTKEPFVLNSNVGTIPYATRHREYSGNCLVSGYGKKSSKEFSFKLLLANLEIIQTRWCNRIHKRRMRKFVCTSSAVSDIQKGDSGGPLVCTGTGDPSESGKGVLVGVVCGYRHRVGSFFTRVSSFHKFVTRGKAMSSCRGNVYVVLISLLYGRMFLF